MPQKMIVSTVIGKGGKRVKNSTLIRGGLARLGGVGQVELIEKANPDWNDLFDQIL